MVKQVDSIKYVLCHVFFWEKIKGAMWHKHHFVYLGQGNEKTLKRVFS
jgi:hypothetical protein